MNRKMRISRLFTVVSTIAVFCFFNLNAFTQPEMVKDINELGDSDPSNLYNANGFLYFNSDDGVNGAELWRSNSTAVGTNMVKDINPGTAGCDADNFISDSYITYFTANDGVSGTELWKTDGTESGTVMVKDIFPGSEGSNPSDLVNINGIIYFSANNSTNGTELWKSDGTGIGTLMVKDIRNGSSGGSPQYLVRIDSTLFFAAYDGINGTELWKSDGTEAGTVLVKDLRTGSNGSYPEYLVNFNDTLFFRASDGILGVELWKSDGSDIGTYIVKDIRQGYSSSSPGYLTNINGTLYFSAYEGLNGTELWKSDGSELGTEMIIDIFPGSGSSYPKIISGINDTLFFVSNDGTNGYELWQSDGSEAGTVMVKDIYPGSSSGISYSVDYFEKIGNFIFFRANDGINGTELWKSDGTEIGTIMVEDTVPGASGSNPENLKTVNGTLYYSADYNLGFGRELWKLNQDQSPAIPYFSSDLVSGDAPLLVDFSDMSSPGSGFITAWNWDFGDGNFSTDHNPSHVYSDFGYHTVSLTVTDNLGVDSTFLRTNYIYVDSLLHVIHIPIEQPTIQAGIDGAAEGDTVLVEPGIYSGFGNFNLDFMGKGILVTSKMGRDSTFIDCGNSGQGFYFHLNEDSTSVLDGFTIINGTALNGGGIQIVKSSPIIKNMVIDTNYATNYGGGIYVDSSNVLFQNIIITSNSANYYGGGLYLINSEVTLDTFEIRSNISIYNSTQSGGGGICCNNSILELHEGYIAHNVVRYLGGGIYCTDSSNMVISNVIVNENIVNASSSNSGCGIHIYNSIANISGAEIVGHDAVNGGGLYALDSECNIENTLFIDNTANRGAGVYMDNSNGNLINLNLTNNDAEYDGGGMYLSDFSGDILNVTITDGMANDGSGIYLLRFGEGEIDSLTLINNIGTDGTLYLQSSNPIISNLIINDNTGDCIYMGSSDPVISNALLANGNYGLLMYYSDPTISHTVIKNNLKGIYCYNSNPILNCVQITGHLSSTPGGGIQLLSSSLARLNNVTISDNITFENGGAIYIDNSVAILENCILKENIPNEIFKLTGGANVNYSNISGGFYGLGNFDLDPIFNDPENGDYSLTVNSPCVDMGNPASSYDPDGTRADIGTYYFDHSQPAGPLPKITSIIDVPDDEGGFVVINWDASTLDVAQYQGITHYSIWREQDWAKTPWEFIDNLPAQYFTEYAYIAPTIIDSSSQQCPYYKYKVTAETNYTGVFYQSQADSGYSIDNLAPFVPDGFYGVLADEQVNLWWNSSPSSDFSYFNIYRKASGYESEFILFSSTSETNFIDIDVSFDTLSYFVTSVDISGNESTPSENLSFTSAHAIILDIKVYLEGAYRTSNMATLLNANGKLPLTQPYNIAPWDYSGTENVSAIPNPDIVDWVLVEIRDTTDVQYATSSTVINRKAAFILGDGSIVDIDGYSNLQLKGSIQYGLYTVIYHRNHLSIISSVAALESDGIYSHDFSTDINQAFGNDSQKFLFPGIYGMISGDGDANGKIELDDKITIWSVISGFEGYNAADYNLDGQTNNPDKDDLWINNLGSQSIVP